ncbi:MAG TPA: ATP-binding cassette domain-containing protein [Candidatus Bacteroides merdigallinarum]|uniref:UvrABC system protein A n=1 Tax=Candidatus Bacteroides merdigallinarum TaxID=2838473 RepID=A0A9D2J1F8_9BACE|nr:ATP-binding cassette domain-containing protein [Candidatus Bacteroides merdigallinarum]
MSASNSILIKGARVNNLKNIDVEIPRNKLVVITGLSGSGKSSLAFDTLYAEGQRRYVESLSSYARQFLGRMSKPECDYIKGIPPAIAIEQKVSSRNPRSTVGTSTEIYEYLRLLYARVGHTFSPVSGREVKKHTPEDIVNCMLEHPEGTRYTVLAPIVLREGRTLAQQLDTCQKEGFTRLEVNGQMTRIDEYTPQEGDTVFLLIDRLTASHEKDALSRLTDSAETAMYEGDGACLLRFWQADGSTSLFRFSTKFEADGITFEEPTDQMFSFNSPIGACPVCEGFGRVIGIDEHLVVPNRALSVYDGAVVCWRGEKMGEWREMVIRGAEKAGFPIFTPYYELTDEQRRMLWEGTRYFEGINAFFKMLQENQYKIQYRVMLARYRGKTVCPACHGTRLKPEANYVRVGGKSISELVDLPITELKQFFDRLKLNDHDTQVAARILAEINSRIRFLLDVGLGYLTLNRLSNSLSGGESQRINLATSLGSSLVGSLYILDEPSIGLHSRDTDKLIRVLRQLQQLGNTVVVVEHDEEIIRAADYIIDIGPKAGRLGGEVVYQGDMKDILATSYELQATSKATCKDKPVARSSSPVAENSYTVRYLLGEETIPVPTQRRPWNNYIEIKGARENNLQGVDVRFPLNVMTVVTGVSGSGKSTLVRDIFYRALKRELDECTERPGEFVSIGGDIRDLRNVEFIDQNPIGKSSRSNPVTYLKAYDDIRKLYADQPLSKQMGYTPGTFSFNSEGGRCEECKGEGTITVEMQFMADLVLECESCHGMRFKPDVLEVRFQGANIHDILEMTVDQAIEFFAQHKQRKIARKLQPLQDVGLGYIKLGQSSSTLSGGENQRVKLAYYLSQEKADPTMFIFDEPTTGLHFHDIRKLLEAFDALLRRGHSITIIEHNLDVIKCADHVIDLGPEGGDRGGRIVVTGTPEEVAACAASYTGQFLREKLDITPKE